MKSSKHFFLLVLIALIIFSVFFYLFHNLIISIFPEFYLEKLVSKFISVKESPPLYIYSAFSNSTKLLFFTLIVLTAFSVSFLEAPKKLGEYSKFKFVLFRLVKSSFVIILTSLSFGLISYFLSINLEFNFPNNFNRHITPKIFFHAKNFNNFGVVGFIIGLLSVGIYRIKKWSE